MNSNFYPEIFNRLIAVFCFAFRNLPESTIGDCITTRDRVKYYLKTLGSFAILFIEIKFKVGSTKELLNATAQIIAECDGQVYSWC